MDFEIQPAPVPAALNSLILLNNPGAHRGASPWLARTAAALSVGVVRRNELVAGGLALALAPDRDYADFPAYLADLAATEPAAWRDRALRRLIAAARRVSPRAASMATDALTPAALLADRRLYLETSKQARPDEPLDLDVYSELHGLLNDPPTLHALVIEHLSAMWERWLEPEWQRVLPVLEDSILRLRALSAANDQFAAALRAVAARSESQRWDRLADGAARTIVLPGPHNGVMTTFLRGDSTLWVCVGLNVFNADLVRSTPVGRAELLFRLQALADDGRLRIIELLYQHEELSAQEIIARSGLSQSSVSRHLNHLRNAGFLRERRQDGANKHYRLLRPHLAGTFTALERWLDRQTPPPDANAQAPADPAPASAVPEEIRRYINAEGRMVTWPNKQKERLLVAAYLAEQFEVGRSYSEREVNAILKPHTGSDVANLRRFMFNSGLINRESDGSRYWREE